MGIKNKKTTNFNWIEFIRVRSTALMLEGGIEPIKKIVEDIEENIEGAKPFFMQYALYDGDLAIVIIWDNAAKPEKSREGLMLVNKVLISHFRENKNSVIINISSVGGKATFPFGALYHGTKFAVEGITESLVFELEQIGVKAKIIEPGTIKTDFAGRSFDFQNDESISEYQPLIKAMMQGNGDVTTDESKASAPLAVAEVIYEAATDGTNKLRYMAGKDAHIFLDVRKDSSDEEYIENVKKQFGL